MVMDRADQRRAREAWPLSGLFAGLMVVGQGMGRSLPLWRAEIQ
jgi:hypothetical protein